MLNNHFFVPEQCADINDRAQALHVDRGAESPE